MLTLFTERVEQKLWEHDLDIIPMMDYDRPGAGDPAGRQLTIKADRQLEMFVDLVGDHSTMSAAFFLDGAYKALSEDEDHLRGALVHLIGLVRAAEDATVGQRCSASSKNSVRSR